MRAVVQRVRRAAVIIDDRQTASIDKGLVVFLGIGGNDDDVDLRWLADKIIHLRIFPDSAGKMNISLADLNGEMLIVSQFTLHGDCRKGRRPGFSAAAPPEVAEPLYRQFIQAVDEKGIRTATGTFQADMTILAENDGPVTMLLDSKKQF
jgi:D-aminoacyl-tRNA deacylase